MFRPLIAAILLLLAVGICPSRAATPADTTPKSSWHQVSPDETTSQNASYDREAEHQLLEMANADRQRAGLPALKSDEGLIRAARTHAAEMASQNQLSHQFSGEAALFQRLAANS